MRVILLRISLSILLQFSCIYISFGSTPPISLLVKINSALGNNVNELRLQPVNNTSGTICIDSFPSMALTHIFIFNNVGDCFPNPTQRIKNKSNRFSRKHIILHPNTESAFPFSVAKGNVRNINGPGSFYILYVIRKPNNASRVIVSPIYLFEIDNLNIITLCEKTVSDRIHSDVKNKIRSELLDTLMREGFSIDKSDMSF